MNNRSVAYSLVLFYNNRFTKLFFANNLLFTVGNWKSLEVSLKRVKIILFLFIYLHKKKPITVFIQIITMIYNCHFGYKIIYTILSHRSKIKQLLYLYIYIIVADDHYNSNSISHSVLLLYNIIISTVDITCDGVFTK